MAQRGVVIHLQLVLVEFVGARHFALENVLEIVLKITVVVCAKQRHE
jgi:hypothetical protein